MNPPAPDEFRRIAREEWNALLAADDSEPNLELLAAFLDDGLDADGRKLAAEEIARSPRALEILQSLLPADRALPTVAPEPVRLPPKSKAESKSNWRPLALAASALVAVAGATAAWVQTARWSRHSLAEQETRGELLRQLVLAQKLQVAEAVATFSPPLLVGSSNHELVANALRRGDQVIRGPATAPEDPDSLDSKWIDDAVTAAGRAIAEARKQSSPARADLQLDEIGVLIQAGRLDAAEKLLIEAEKSDTPAVRNARGAWLLRKGFDAKPDEAEPLFAEAERKLQSAIAGEPLAWLNLSALYAAQFENDKAEAAARRYAAETKDPRIQEWIERKYRADHRPPGL